jgi:hypothetical protein
VLRLRSRYEAPCALHKGVDRVGIKPGRDERVAEICEGRARLDRHLLLVPHPPRQTIEKAGSRLVETGSSGSGVIEVAALRVGSPLLATTQPGPNPCPGSSTALTSLIASERSPSRVTALAGGG